MSVNKRLIVALVILFASLSAVALAADPAIEWDGLQKTKIKGIDHAYVRPGVDISKYSKVMLDPVEVSFDKNWKPERTGSHFQLRQEDRDRIKRDLAALAAKTFTKTLGRKDGYPVVTTAGPDVMRVSAALTDV